MNHKLNGYIMKKLLFSVLLAMMCMGARAQQQVADGDTTCYDLKEFAKMGQIKMPKYKSGIAAAMQYVCNNLKYPKEAEKNNIECKLTMSFIVEKDGSLSHIVPVFTGVHFFDVKKLSQKTGISEQELINYYGKLFQDEAIRVLSAMPNWKPGKIDGNPVRVRGEMPVTFGIPRFTGMGRR